MQTWIFIMLYIKYDNIMFHPVLFSLNSIVLHNNFAEFVIRKFFKLFIVIKSLFIVYK